MIDLSLQLLRTLHCHDLIMHKDFVNFLQFGYNSYSTSSSNLNNFQHASSFLSRYCVSSPCHFSGTLKLEFVSTYHVYRHINLNPIQGFWKHVNHGTSNCSSYPEIRHLLGISRQHPFSSKKRHYTLSTTYDFVIRPVLVNANQEIHLPCVCIQYFPSISSNSYLFWTLTVIDP